MARHTSHIPQWKKDEIEKIKNLVQSNSLFGMVGVGGIPAKQFQAMRKDLIGIAIVKVSRNTLIKRSLDELGAVNVMNKFIDKQTAFVFTDKNPFKLFKTLENSKTPAPIKAGAIAPQDIIVEKGPTSFPPGPILGDLQGAGIPAAIDKGKVVIKDTSVVAKEGEVVSQKLAAMLSRLEIYPMVVGIDLRAVYDGETIFEPAVLRIDTDEIFANFSIAASEAFNLSVNSAYPTIDTIGAIISKASTDAQNLGINATIFESDIMGALLGKAHSSMLAIARAVMEKDENAVGDELKNIINSTPVACQEEETPIIADEEEKEEESTEEEEEESGMAGLGALFG
ncbi:MAG: 50S ribosomal protein L10 [Methanosarcinaceae archaeon]|jgi:large subunit ribosomal protein L10|nr:50S ribosomal protein L10 [Methanosarcinaceae archaeon]NKQ39208.1 50S ribosomal protein L10 [Methanosarcinales archaeon]